jgi:ketosteroid isomerase-like protein
MDWPELEHRVRETFERWNRGDPGLEPEWTSPDVEIVSRAGQLTGGSYRGYDGVREWLRDMFDPFGEWTLQLDELSEPGPGRILGVGSAHFRGRGSGVGVDLPCAWIIDHEDGLLTRLEPLPNRVEEARALVADP